MKSTIRKFARTAMLATVAALFNTMGPCQQVQYPPYNTESYVGVALALPKVMAGEFVEIPVPAAEFFVD
jgi:hypothetical protein